jgi:hypothetical protein
MPWKSAAINVGGSLLGGAFGGGSKKAAREAKRSAVAQLMSIGAQKGSNIEAFTPYIISGAESNDKLDYALGTSARAGYHVPKPTREQVEAENMPAITDYGYALGKKIGALGFQQRRNEYTDKLYQEALQKWENDANQYATTDSEFGALNKKFTAEDFVKEPGYQARLLEGEQGINRNGIARGSFDSGASLKELERYRQDYASNEFSNAYNRDNTNKTRTFDFLTSGANRGLNASANLASLNTGLTSGAAGNLVSSGNTISALTAQSQNNSSNNIQNTIGNLLYAYNRGNTNTGQTPPYYPSGGSSSFRARDMFVGG